MRIRVLRQERLGWSGTGRGQCVQDDTGRRQVLGYVENLTVFLQNGEPMKH